ncbi:MAG TPA: hypothetical protein VGE51_07165 [Fontimonas sp.]
MIGTLIAGSTAVFLAATAALDMVDGIVDRRRLNTAKPQPPRVAVPVASAPATPSWQAPELLKAA